ncbi:MAG: hypothetical protein D3909_16815 [Candidatus Electrothrix sp. ATG1]|nr:hypothetical protein [Candidatus Electrothrix sp. ATG1]
MINFKSFGEAMKTFSSCIVLISLCTSMFLTQATSAVAAKKKSSYGTLTGVRFIKNYDGDTIRNENLIITENG